MRLDRFFSIHFAAPCVRLGIGAERQPCLPILMYHSISNRPEIGLRPYYKTATHPARFAEQMRFLDERGFSGIDLESGLRSLRQNVSSSEKLVAITFDDGFWDVYTEAFPVLQRYGFTATVFLPTAYISKRRHSFKGIDCLTWNEVRALRAHGIRFGSHTIHHPTLQELTWEDVQDEVRASKAEIEQHLHEAICGFSYPYAFPQAFPEFVNRIGELLRQLGYNYAVTTRIGRATVGDDVFSLKRLPVNSFDDDALFQAKVEGAYDWLSVFQALLKRCKAFLCVRSRFPSMTP